MKKLLQILLLTTGLIGCSAIDYSELTSPVSPIDTQIDRIIALNLSYSDSIDEANKLIDPDLVAAIVKELEIRRLKAENEILDEKNIEKFSENIIVSDNNSIFIGPEINERKQMGLLLDSDYEDYFLRGSKDLSNGIVSHNLVISISYTADKLRNYKTASFCNKWQDCSSGEQLDIIPIRTDAGSCSGSSCKYTETFELNISDDVLRKFNDDGISIRMSSKRVSNKITLSALYVKGYLRVAK